jgi:CO/xanthine dehydrogenase Mo-binding subunit
MSDVLDIPSDMLRVIAPRGQGGILEGDAPQGQSHETTMAQVAAHEFSIEISELPLRPNRFWRLIQEAERATRTP